MKKSAFTLIELLVVIAIIAILASIALPVFGKVYERGKAANDANNLHQLGVGITAYLNDNDDQLFATTGGTVTWPVALHEKYITNWKTFVSPFDKRPVVENGNTPVSYGFNPNVFGTNASKWKSPSQLIIMAPKVASQSGDVTFAENSGTDPKLDLPSGDAKGGTHNGRSQINVLFADAHTEGMNYRKFADTNSPDGMRAWKPEGVPGQ